MHGLRIVNPFLAYSMQFPVKKKLSDFSAFPDLLTWRQDGRVFATCWVLIGQFKFPARQCKESELSQSRFGCNTIKEWVFILALFKEKENLKGINHKSPKNDISHTFCGKRASFDIQTCSIDLREQYGCHDNAQQQGLFPLGAFIYKHGEPLITTRAMKLTIKYY